jgi:hypothetical protein
MKKLLLMAVLLVVSVQGYSQAGKYGIRGGYNISNLDFETTPTTMNKHRNSVYLGFFADFMFSKSISIVPEIQFSAEGAKEESLQLDFIQAPILFKFRLSDKMHIGAGPQVSLKVHKVDDGIKNLTYSGVGSFEYKINYAIFADVRYTYGISNIFDENLGISAKNSNVQLGVGYKF